MVIFEYLGGAVVLVELVVLAAGAGVVRLSTGG
jgi:hypothetical protein